MLDGNISKEPKVLAHSGHRFGQCICKDQHENTIRGLIRFSYYHITTLKVNIEPLLVHVGLGYTH
ncbi:hypothetical protein Lal_00037669 [Lupinus albus]|nr:hypothetical protein Lal_00037669 [Lupinus albus]